MGSAILRKGAIGDYYGTPMSDSAYIGTNGSGKDDPSDMQKVNARYIHKFFSGRGWSLNAICGMLGNMTRESTLNPGCWQSHKVGKGPAYGLVQWDPYTKYTQWAASNEYPDYSEMDAQLMRITVELEVSYGSWQPGISQWQKKSPYNMSFDDYIHSEEDVAYLTKAFLKCYEKAGVEELDDRVRMAEFWYKYLFNVTPANEFVPREDDAGMRYSDYWYSPTNIFYGSDGRYGLPNCTCYAWGRFWEISDQVSCTSGNVPSPKMTGNAGNWISNLKKLGDECPYELGLRPTERSSSLPSPRLGAVACWGRSGHAGHVAIVERIDMVTGDFWVSQSGYTRSSSKMEKYYFMFPENSKKRSKSSDYGEYVFQGFIYNPFVTDDINKFSPYITHIDQISPIEIQIKLSRINSGMMCYYKWNSDTVSIEDNDGYINIDTLTGTTTTFTIDKKRDAHYVSMMLVPYGDTTNAYDYAYQILVPSVPCMWIPRGGLKKSIPLVKYNGEIREVIPVVRCGDSLYKIFDTDAEKL